MRRNKNILGDIRNEYSFENKGLPASDPYIFVIQPRKIYMWSIHWLTSQNNFGISVLKSHVSAFFETEEILLVDTKHTDGKA